jgi:GxxExxY protein
MDMLRLHSKLEPAVEDLIHRTIGCCIIIHRELGPGLIEKIYQRAVGFELDAAGIPFEDEKPFPVTYRGKRLYTHRLDLVVAGTLVLELKAIDRLHPIHLAQTISSLKVSQLQVGLLINFNVSILPDGIRRVVL